MSDLIERLREQYVKTNLDYEKKLSPGRELWKLAANALEAKDQEIERLEAQLGERE